MKSITTIVIIFMLFSCKSKYPQLITIEKLEVERYMGLWYEIARLPNLFEKGLICVTANYKLLSNGEIEVINTGLNEKNSKIKKQAKGKAHIPNLEEPGKLKVTFFWPFYGNYWILHLDEGYNYVLIGEPKRKYLWILSRKPSLDKEVYLKLIDIANANSFDVEKILLVDQNCRR